MESTNATRTAPGTLAENILRNLAAEWTSAVPLLSAIVPVLLGVIVYSRSRKQRPLPPGPRGWPLLGNALDMPREKGWLAYTQWGKTYGDVSSLSIFGSTFIILNSTKAAFDLLHKRSSIYSDRPHLVMAGDLIGWDKSLSGTPYGENFRQMRRLTHQIFSPHPVQQFWPAQEQESARFLNRLLQTPENFIDHIRHTTGAIILKISHGYTVSVIGEDPFVALAEKTLEEFSLANTPGAFWVDFLPWLKYVPSWLPGAGFRRTANEWRKNLFHMADIAHEFTKSQMAKGTAVPSFTSGLLEGSYSPETESLVKWTAFSIYGGGADTTVSAITTFFLAMCTHPQVQIAARAELDAVVGNERLPNMTDRPSLPYINAIVKEVLRWGPVVPGGVPHRLTRDDEYKGYRIPAGSLVMSNIWGMARNADVFPDPDEFHPDRFIGPDKVEDSAGADPLQFVFGFGRRICPGQHLAEPSLFLAIATTLATFTIAKARNEDSGKIIEPAVEWIPGIISHPKPFPCDIKPRSPRAVDLIKQAVGEDRT